MKFAVIIPDRGDRPELTRFCLKQLERMTLKPDRIFHINEPAKDSGFDLIYRVKLGVNEALLNDFDLCFIVENDDALPADYFNRFLPFMREYDFFGDDSTYYYNIKTLRWSLFEHKWRSSLFTTGFKISALNNFEWPSNDNPFLDIKLWEYARHKKRIFVDTGAVGIKHGDGLCGGKGHLMKLHNPDPDMSFLKSKLSDYHIDFYEQYRRRSLEAVAHG